MSDQHVDADRLRFVRNAADAIAVHLGLVLDQDGYTVVPPDGATVLEAAARLLYARHPRDRFGTWDELTDEARAWWVGIATDAALRIVPIAPVIAERLYNLLGDRPRTSPWATLARGERARFTITAQHVARLIAQHTRRDLERAQAEASRMNDPCPVCGSTRLTARCVREQHGITQAEA